MLDDLPPLRETIAEHGLAAKKGLGQHFLLDLNLTRKIAGFCEAGEGNTILEIGPGPGGLTRALLETGADVFAIERDRRIAPVLEELADATGRLKWEEADALKADDRALVGDDVVIASNLPYNISTELLIKWLTVEPRFWRRLVLMFQKEVGDRILAEPGSKTYGRLSVIAQAASKPRLGFHLPARAFTPPPKVDSSVLIFENDGRPENLKELERVTEAAFGQRRKMLRQSLKSIFSGDVSEVLEQEGLSPTARAEMLSVESYRALAKRLAER
ncbi:16S rRNA (adenine(1518)-N(6)/adenine(1519)-N(6))-dimethyltransferase RsmA [Parvularcula sp. ZS-1/3]|uniref:Ribosomal RNA small subunit methyltransferase A n=1 Tax=Parvularcula mediterranea TaxID=2732508 RepID=A0A7Y3W5M8_9PROT|nr:16S rRNA (adenine(1518)-N(6)/adenine(1519)-N(6))-dimethyltransferase RsmA [Parvularcula mediterranea]NNU16673.1 16S rRNA (adenine(1518)-N(6)/adenine(1519)-N(6))-dimethyltransferase RsmA [Parvularcula mediterranea]